MRCAVYSLRVAFAVITALTLTLTLTLGLASSSANAQALLSQDEAYRLLRQGGVALLLRHGQTESGIGDPPGFTLENCASQRNLSDEGRAELRDMAARLSLAKVSFNRAFTSRWCRCRETAQLLTVAPATIEDWAALNSQFAGNTVIDKANAQVVAKIKEMPATARWLLVTHQVNITATTGVTPSPGEGVLVQPTRTGIKVLGRVRL